MRLSVALDEIEAVNEPRVQENEAYLPVALLSRVVSRLGPIRACSAPRSSKVYFLATWLTSKIYTCGSTAHLRWWWVRFAQSVATGSISRWPR